MRRISVFLILCVLYLFLGYSGSTGEYYKGHNSVTGKKFNGVFQAPARRSLLSDAIQGTETDTALVAGLDGTIYLLELGSTKPLWSFSSGQTIYSSYQASVNDTENVSGIGGHYFIDCGDDWELYAHNSLGGKLKLMKTIEEYVSSTPQIEENGGIVLGSKRTTVFIVDKKTGSIINTFSTPDSPAAMQSNENGFFYNTTVDELVQSSSDIKTDQKRLYITRTDYTLTSFIPNSNKVLWNMTVAEIGAAFLCPEIEESLDQSTSDSDSSEPRLPFTMPLNCRSRARVYRFRTHNIFEPFSGHNWLPEPHGQDLMLPAPKSDALPSQPNIDKVLELLPSLCNSDKILDVHYSQDPEAVPSFQMLDDESRKSHVQDVKLPSNDGSMLFPDNFISFQLILFSIGLLAFVVYHYNLITVVKVKLIAQPSYVTGVNVSSKRKKPRKSGKGRSNSEKMDKEENLVNNTCNDFLNLNQPNSYIDGRNIGKLFVSSKEIAKGSNGTIVVEGIYEGRPVAVKRLVRAHHDIASKEIQNLVLSDHHPNIVRWYGVEQDQDFVYLALERSACSLNDLIHIYSKSSIDVIISKNMDSEFFTEYRVHLESIKGTMQEVELWKADGYPSPVLLKLMRDVICGLVHLHELGIVHRDLKPQNVLIFKDRSFSAKLSDMGISKRLVEDTSSLGHHATGCGSSGWQAPEQLLRQRQTRAVDVFSLGCILFFCFTGGRHPFGNPLERDINIAKNKVDLFLVEHIPEAVDLFFQLLNPNAEMRPKASEVLYHPLFWSAELRLSFLRDTSDTIELEDRETDSPLLKALESTAPLALGTKWDEKMEPAFLNNIGCYRRYKYDSVRHLLRVMRNKLNHYRELPTEIQELIGSVPEGFDRYFKTRYPKLLIEVYKVMYAYCREEEWFLKYFEVLNLQ
ncbi:serine threonine- kinase endoribonuclease IRE1a isoform X1 [Olea europaea subsp. europaea]|uniref:non-specific serine/threonine protein kinase n=2 Tax=Olea europaea subsp. europaea TaxID=158383 RepID=A0A8S0R1G9_OLEEU|nr:serine threonine- kinase endoribonuclease IRE1a isoform X1 [Olea europaea subsp. europaea]